MLHGQYFGFINTIRPLSLQENQHFHPKRRCHRAQSDQDSLADFSRLQIVYQSQESSVNTSMLFADRYLPHAVLSFMANSSRALVAAGLGDMTSHQVRNSGVP